MPLPRLFARENRDPLTQDPLPGPAAGVQPGNADPEPTRPPSIAPRGGSGRFNYEGFLQLEELNWELRHPHSHRVYDRMWRTDGDIRRTLWMFLNPILGGTWSVEPAGGDHADAQAQKAADLVRWALFENLDGGLVGHLNQALPVAARSGFCPFEQVWAPAKYEGKTVLVPQRLLMRLPRSVLRFPQDEWDQLASIQQLTMQHGLVTLDAADLVYYRVGAEGDNWEGVSLLRPAYKHWYLKDKIERLDAIAQERHATGLPIVYPPEAGDLDEDVIDELEAKLENIRQGELGYLVMPGPHAAHSEHGRGWLFEMQGMGGPQNSGRDAQPSLQYHTDKIAAAMVTEFMRIGQSGTGARATAYVQQDPFLAAVEAFASTVVEPTLNVGGDTASDGIVERIVNLNMGPQDAYPRVVLSLVDATSLAELGDLVQKLVAANALQPDEPLEDYLRERTDLPPADPIERARRERLRNIADEKAAAAGVDPGKDVTPIQDDTPPMQDAATGKPRPGKEPPEGKQTHTRARRELRPWEQHMSLDQIETSVDSARALFEQAAAAHVRQVAAAVAPAVHAGEPTDQTAPGDLVAALVDPLQQLYTLGRQTVVDELNRQRHGATVTHAATFAIGDTLGQLRAHAAEAARAVMAAIVGRIAALRLHDPQATVADLQAAGEQAAIGALHTQSQLHAAAALDLGRDDQAQEMADEILGARYTSILDANRCEQCAHADDGTLRALDDPVLLDRKPPNRHCAGGGRCRCMLFYELRDEQPAGEPVPIGA